MQPSYGLRCGSLGSPSVGSPPPGTRPSASAGPSARERTAGMRAEGGEPSLPKACKTIKLNDASYQQNAMNSRKSYRRWVPVAVLSLMALVVLDGCESVSDAGLAAEVAPLVRPGDFVGMAMVHLEQHGFICDLQGFDVTCTRQRYTRVIISCSQRVTLLGARASNVISNVRLGPTPCFGGFG